MVINIKGAIDNLKSLPYETLENYKYIIIVFLVADLFGIYWYFNLKKLGIALMIVCLIALGVILFLERDKKPIVQNNTNPPAEKPKLIINPKPPEEPEFVEYQEPSPEDFGLPDPDEYNKRLEKAIGKF